MASVNKVILVGNLGKDPEVRHTADGTKIVNLSVATSESWKDKGTGEKKERTEWHRVVIFNEPLGDIAEKYLKKGSKVFLEGQIRTRKVEDGNSVEKYITEIILFRFKGMLILLDNRTESNPQYLPGFKESDSEPSKFSDINLSEELGDEIPF